MRKEVVQKFATLLLVMCFDSAVVFAQTEDSQKVEEKTPQQQAAEQDQQQQAPPKDPLRWTKGRYTLKLGIEAGGQWAPESNSWWNLSKTFAPTSGFKPDLSWVEVYFRPSLTASVTLNKETSLYGGVSMAATANLNKDVFGQGNSGRILLDDAYAGIRHKNDKGLELDFSAGAQAFRIGNGFLIANGAANGFERGATTMLPRRAWQTAALAKIGYKKFSGTAFYLDPNELKSSDSKTRLAGAKFEYTPARDEFVGFAYITSPRSEYAYIQAPINFITNGRDGLQTFHGYAKLRPAKKSAPGFLFQADVAKQWNDRIDLDAWAMNFDVANTFVKRKWLPTIGYAFRYYSGDNPATTKLERFDSLYYDGGPSTFASGGNGSFAFYNSNILVHRVKFGLVFDPKNIFDAYYFHIRAAQRNSPIQFGQGFRFDFVNGVPVLNTGVPNKHLADDLYFQYTRVITKNLFFTSGFAVSFPGRGLVRISNNTADSWIGGIANLVVAF